MATRKPWIHPNGSSASLKGMEIAIPPGKTQPSPYKIITPPPAPGVYEFKPLPPVPLRRSVASSFTSEVNNAFQTPKRSVDYAAAAVAHDVDWEQQEEASIAVILERDVRSEQVPPPYRPKNMTTHIDADRIPDLPPDNVLLPQSKMSVSKILRLTSSSASAKATSLSPTSPSGHNPSHKIRQIMGVDVDVSDEVLSVSPLSRSSVYSEDLALSVSEPDTDTYGAYYHSDPDDDARSSRWTSWVPESPADVPRSLRIQRPISGRYSDPPASPSAAARRPSSSCRHLHHRCESSSSSSSYGTGLYHASAHQIAKTIVSPTSRSTLHSPASPPISLVISSSSNAAAAVSPSSADRPALSFTGRLPTRARMAPPPPELHRRSPTASPSSFGSGGHPLRTPYPPAAMSAARSAFDGDSDSEASSSSRHCSSALLERGRNLFRRRSSDVVEIVTPVSAGEGRWRGLVEESVREHEAAVEERKRRARERLAIDTSGGNSSGVGEECRVIGKEVNGSASETGRENRGKGKRNTAAAAAGLSTRQGTADAPFRAMPPLLARTGGQISGLVASARKTVGAVGLKSREERRRESLKNRIRVLSDGGDAGDPPRNVVDSEEKWL